VSVPVPLLTANEVWQPQWKHKSVHRRTVRDGPGQIGSASFATTNTAENSDGNERANDSKFCQVNFHNACIARREA
jgi:hypothetical protein